MVKRASDLAALEACAVIAFDEKRHAATLVGMASPCEGVVEGLEFLEKEPILAEWRDSL